MNRRLIIMLFYCLLFSTKGEAVMAFNLKSPVFEEGSFIPKKYTCDGDDISPPLKWEGAPGATKSYVLMMDDPDAPVGTWDHWVLFNIPLAIGDLPEGIKTPPDGATEGKNSWGRTGYGGPCPPEGTHRYVFKLYALDQNLSLASGSSKKEIERAMAGHILAQSELVGKYVRNR